MSYFKGYMTMLDVLRRQDTQLAGHIDGLAVFVLLPAVIDIKLP